jgi:hypothetical protein
MSTKRYVVRPSKLLGHIKRGYFVIDMDDATFKRFKASAANEQERFIRLNAKFILEDAEINLIKDVSNIAEM